MVDAEEQMEQLRAIKARYEGELMCKPNVVGVGIGFRKHGGTLTGEPSIVVSVTHKVPDWELNPEDRIPRELDGVPVDVQAVGRLQALADRVG